MIVVCFLMMFGCGNGTFRENKIHIFVVILWLWNNIANCENWWKYIFCLFFLPHCRILWLFLYDREIICWHNNDVFPLVSDHVIIILCQQFLFKSTTNIIIINNHRSSRFSINRKATIEYFVFFLCFEKVIWICSATNQIAKNCHFISMSENIAATNRDN